MGAVYRSLHHILLLVVWWVRLVSGRTPSVRRRRARIRRGAAVLSGLMGLVALTACVATTQAPPRPSTAPTGAPAPPAFGVPTTAACEASLHVACYSPAQIRAAYDLDALYRRGLDGRGTTIAIVDSFGSPTIRQDLARFDTAFHLPSASLKIIQPAGRVPRFDPADSVMVGWARETSLDVEWAHAIAPGANLLLVETPVAETEGVHGFPEIVAAENYVIDHHLAQVISQSLAATEETFPGPAAIRSLRSAFRNARAHDVTVIGATGDAGPTSQRLDITHLYTSRVTNWPATDPLVTAVGGTALRLDAQGRRTAPDAAWNDTLNRFAGRIPYPRASGGGRSSVFARPSYQDTVRAVVGDARGIPDISMSASYDGAVLVYQSFLGRRSGYSLASGTSEAAPEFAGVVAIADQAAGRPLGFLNPMLYRLAAGHAAGIVDVTHGNTDVSFTQDGRTYRVRGWSAGPGYDLATGLGTVDAAKLVEELAALAGGAPPS